MSRSSFTLVADAKAVVVTAKLVVLLLTANGPCRASIVHGSGVHGDECLRDAVGEEEGVLVGAGDQEGRPWGPRRRRWLPRCAFPRGPLLHHVDGVEEGLVGEEEEPELLGVRPHDAGGDDSSGPRVRGGDAPNSGAGAVCGAIADGYPPSSPL